MKRHELLIVDDEKEILRSLTLTFEDDYEVFTAPSGSEALDILGKQDIAVVIADQRMPEMTGVEFLQKVIEINPYIIRIILTGYTDTTALVQAINRGHIYQYITKPWERHELKIVVKRAVENYELVMKNQQLVKDLKIANKRLQNENTFLKKEVVKNLQFSDIICQSLIMKEVMGVINKVINNSISILLTGETGTGKTLIARYIHHHGPRKNKLFIEQNCGTIPETLLESELFGHRKGAFTGATNNQQGLFEIAEGGTILLDEISEMSPELQVKLLQVLQEGWYRRLGEGEYRQANVRIITATNKDIQDEVQKGKFRSDLYYRINVFPIHIPPLRERIDDIPLLADYFLKKYSHKLNNQIKNFSEDALQRLCCYDFPGNVRELENLIERALILSTGTQIGVGEWLPVSINRPEDLSTLEIRERNEIRRLLKLHAGNLGLVARDINMSRTTLWRRLKEYGLEA
ncbi:MAG: sigma-54-dependent Fis family transcriptional regulator [Gammaproteobacteria bacterium]|nr:sigma-54-dependent Fis family transcriptional regulator [Gammaproteobacteria bacterium]